MWDGLADAEDQAPHLVLKAQRFRVPVRRVQIPACTAGIYISAHGKRRSIMVNIIHVESLTDSEWHKGKQ